MDSVERVKEKFNELINFDRPRREKSLQMVKESQGVAFQLKMAKEVESMV